MSAIPGDKFRIVVNMPEDWTNQAIGVWLINKVVLVHLQNARDKFRMLLWVNMHICSALMLIAV